MNKKLTILYAEDDHDDFMILSDAFKAYDETIKVTRAENGLKAIDYLSNLEPGTVYPSLIILDMNMPVMDGKETLIRLKAFNQFSNIPVVIFTTSSDMRDKHIIEEFNVPFYTKPISYQDLNPIIKMFVAHSERPNEGN